MADPAYPSAFVDTDTMPTVNGSTFTVNAGGDIQAAINSAAAANGNLTHEVVIQAGASFSLGSQLTLPAKNGANPAGTGWIIIRTSNLAGIAAQKQRIIQASHTAAMPHLTMTATPYGLATAWDAHHYRFIGIEFIRAGAAGNSLANIWADPNQGSIAGHQPHHIIFDRCILRQTSAANKIIIFMGANLAVVDSLAINQTAAMGDSNAVWIGEGAGPIRVWNNYLECAGEVIFHGSTEYGTGYRPTDVEVRRNLIRAPLQTTGKNLIEWKGGLRCWVAGNVFDLDVGTGQPNSIQVTPRAEESSTNIVDDLILEYNLVRDVKVAFGLSGYNPPFGSPGHRYAVRHNYAYNVNRGDAHAFTEGNGVIDATIDHNTIINTGAYWMKFTNDYDEVNWIARNTIAYGTVASLWGAGTDFGTTALNRNAPGRVFSKNVLVGAASGQYSGTDLSNNYFPGSISLNADGSLAAGSPYINAATDGTDIGANLAYPSEGQNGGGWYSVYSLIRGVGRFGNGANDFYAYTGQWPLGGPNPPTAPTNLRVVA